MLLLTGSALAQESQPPPDEIEALKEEVRALREQQERQQQEYERRLAELQQRLLDIESSLARPEETKPEVEESLEAEISRRLSAEQTAAPPTAMVLPSVEHAYQSMNPDISVIIDTLYHSDNTSEGIGHMLGEIGGFGHSHGGDDEHHHGVIEDGFNLRHLELVFAGDVDPYFKAWAIAAVSEQGAELEEAVIQTTCLPAGFQFQAGKFFSNFDRINAQHSHEWDFVDEPLIHRLVFGDHGLNDKGVQLSWLAPTSFYLLAGVEVFQGGNELMFNHIGGDELPREQGPRVGVGWLKFAPNLPGNHGLQLGLFGGAGVHEEAHDGDSDGTLDHWLQGDSTFYGGDVVYKYNSSRPYGQGDITCQAEYMGRKRDLEVKQHDLVPALVGNSRVDEQDGLYAQATYGFLPRWRGGVRWDQVGLLNRSSYPDGRTASFGDSRRLSAMVDFTPTEFSRFRLQLARGQYELEESSEDAWEVWLQLMISLGTHGAHKF